MLTQANLIVGDTSHIPQTGTTERPVVMQEIGTASSQEKIKAIEEQELTHLIAPPESCPTANSLSRLPEKWQTKSTLQLSRESALIVPSATLEAEALPLTRRDTLASTQDNTTASHALTNSIAPPECATTSTISYWSEEKSSNQAPLSVKSGADRGFASTTDSSSSFSRNSTLSPNSERLGASALAQSFARETSPRLVALRQKLLLPLPATVLADSSLTSEVNVGQGLMEKGLTNKAYTTNDTDETPMFGRRESLKSPVDKTNVAKLSAAVTAYNAMIEQSNLEFLSHPPAEVLALREALLALTSERRSQ
ncbi:MAG TPA: hypothetical protein V6C85_06250 [Allocoleopsis sp.]